MIRGVILALIVIGLMAGSGRPAAVFAPLKAAWSGCDEQAGDEVASSVGIGRSWLFQGRMFP